MSGVPRSRPGLRAYLWRAAILILLVSAMGWLLANLATNMARMGLQSGFDFLWRAAGFRLGESLIPYEASDSYGRALIAGMANTLRVALIGCVLATLLGFTIGVMRLSTNPLLRGLTGIYVECLRNTPVLLQLVLWQAIVLRLPPVRAALEPLPGVHLSQRGLQIPALMPDVGLAVLAGSLALALLFSWWLLRRARSIRNARGHAAPVWPVACLAIVGLPLLIAAVTGAWPNVDWPALRGFNFTGGSAITPEYAALLFGLVVYASAFIAEIVRAGVQSVSVGQWEAAQALGLRRGRVMRLVIVPQALRLAVPPLTSQYVNLTKNTSLGVVIGFPEFASVANTIINQTGQAIEVLSIFMGAYLVLSLTTSALMNRYNARFAAQER